MNTIHLDTHVAIWMYESRPGRISRSAARLLARCQPVISPFVRLELHQIREAGRIRYDPEAVLSVLTREAGAELSQASLAIVVEHATTFAWTRDPFDRLIVANAMADGCGLITADERIRALFPGAVW